MWSDRPPLRPNREGEVPPAVEAAEQLRYIRDVMARTDPFTAVPGRGSMGMGLLALIATIILAPTAYGTTWLLGWGITLVMSVLVGGISLVRKAMATGIPLASGSGRKFVLALLPALLAGGVLTWIIWQSDMIHLLPGIWMLMYGVGVLAGGAFSIRLIPLVGTVFMVGSVLAFVLPGNTPHWVFGGSFSIFHLVFGYLIAQRYGG